MEQLRRQWQAEQGWANPDARTVLPVPRPGGGWPGGPRGNGVPPTAAPRPAVAVAAPPPPPVAAAVVPDRGARMATLRRAIILSEVLGPPRALRDEGGFW